MPRALSRPLHVTTGLTTATARRATGGLVARLVSCLLVAILATGCETDPPPDEADTAAETIKGDTPASTAATEGTPDDQGDGAEDLPVADGDSGSLCALDIVSHLNDALSYAGLVGYAFTVGSSSDGSGCTYDMTHNMEDISPRALAVSLTDPEGDPTADGCEWGYQIDSDSYSTCGRFEVFWGFYTEQFVGNSNRLSETQTVALHLAFWDIFNAALDEGRVPTDVAGEQEAAEQAEADAAAAELGTLTRDESGCLTSDEMLELTGIGFSPATGAPTDGCTYDVLSDDGATVTITETDSGLGVYNEQDFDTRYEAGKAMVGNWARSVTGAGSLVGQDSEFAEWDQAVGRGKVGNDDTLWTLLVQYPEGGAYQDYQGELMHTLWDGFDEAYRLGS